MNLLRACLPILLALAACRCGDNRLVAAPTDGNDSAVGRPPCQVTRGAQVRTRQVLNFPGESLMLVTSPPNDRRLFIVSQGGKIHLAIDEVVQRAPFLDLSATAGGPVLAGGERGLLGLAFHPNYATNRRFFVYYTTEAANIVAEYTASPGAPNLANPGSRKILLTIPDPFANHNGGMMEFGADGFLYIGTGDGGSANDPHNASQSTSNLLGKLLRINIDQPADGRPYGIPADNPFRVSGGAPEVFAYGLRNPWRWSFDRGTGDMYIADVGQGAFEELNIVKANTGAGKNFGWREYEAHACQNGPCNPQGKTFPTVVKPRTEGWCSIIGGEVYRGGCYPDLTGTYLYTDFCAGGLHALRYQNNEAMEQRQLTGTFPTGMASIHADSRGELYITTVSGGVFQIEVVP